MKADAHADACLPHAHPAGVRFALRVAFNPRPARGRQRFLNKQKTGAVRSKPASDKAAIYLRVSTEEQRERQSIDTQREFGTKYTDLHQLPVQDVYADDGVSGTVPLEKRPAGQRILEAARRGEFNQLLVYKLDRLGRDTRLILNAVAELEKHGVRVHSMTKEFDTALATGRLMVAMLSGIRRPRTRSDP